MKRLCTVLATIGLLTAFSVGAWADDSVLEADTMVGVDFPFLMNANPIRGVNGAGFAWVLDEAEVELDRDGKLDVEVEGLIIRDMGFNPGQFFRAIVSCLSVDGANVVIVNVITTNGAEVMEGDPRDGNARIKADLVLPTPCIAPIVFVAAFQQVAWLAATGFDDDSDSDSDSDSD